MEEVKTVLASSSQSLGGFKEVGEAGRGQAIVTVAGLTLQEARDGDPLLTQPDQIGVGWARAIEPLLAHPGYNFSCAPTSGCQREEGADVGLESCFLPVGPESTFLGSA